MNGQWHHFSPEGNDQAHQAYVAYIQNAQSSTATIVAGGVERIINFDAMTQTHAGTKKVRDIRVVAGVPQQWVSTPAALLTQRGDLASCYIEVTNTGLIDCVQHILQSSGHAWDDTYFTCSRMKKATVTSVHRIEKFQLWHRYQARLTAMRGDQAKYGVSVRPVPLDLDGAKAQ